MPRSPQLYSLLVVPCDSITAALTLHQHLAASPSIAILNFADPVKPGGGYMNGRTAQEEDVCRAVPALFPALAVSAAYPLDPAAAPPVIHAAIWREPPFSSRLSTAVPVTVVTAAAPNGNGALSAAVPLQGPGYRADFRRRMHHALRAAHAAGCSTVILGAWGCGVFRNRPDDVAALWSEVLDALEWRGLRVSHLLCRMAIRGGLWRLSAVRLHHLHLDAHAMLHTLSLWWRVPRLAPAVASIHFAGCVWVHCHIERLALLGLRTPT